MVLDFSAQCADDPDFLLQVDDIQAWEREHGPLPDGGWMLYRTGWDARSDSQERFTNADETGPHTPGMSPECAQWVAEQSPVIGVGVETVGTDAGAAHSFDPAFPCHSFLMGSGKYGLTQLQNLASLPPDRRGARGRAAADRDRVGRAGPGGRPRRALTVPTVAEVVGRTLVEAGIDHVFGVVGSGNFHVTNAMVAAGARFVAARHEGGAATMADAFARTTDRPAAVTVHQGCGLTNAMTGITEAAKSRTPVVVVAAEATEPRSNFYVDQSALARAVGAVPFRVDDPATAARVAREAVHTAVTTRRTVLLNLPLAVQAARGRERRLRRRRVASSSTPEVVGSPTSTDESPLRRRSGWPRPYAGPSGRCSWPVAGPAARGPAVAAGRRAGRGAAGRVGRREGPVRRPPVVAGGLRRLRLTAVRPS